ncbi:MAG: phosphoribosylaminoimidazolesuccinocarboxamide synthase [Flammeovirgaceae bacterium]|nr:phosphoribosylaminoimidazolesuccinocarboxamide synthase [Flammeovirgaceae bacterium]PDH44270.1 MAG: phosphoribosylaminoimidazolesuccinocarboxamide synthase [Rhodothermaeota bacterium MED-G18]
MNQAIKNTDFKFESLIKKYTGKVRDVYYFKDKIVMIVTDRISAFDVVLPRPIPYKGQILNQIAEKFLNMTEDIVPNWIENVPDPNVTIGKSCKTFPVEMVIRGYLTGHAWRLYRSGKREICGVIMPEGMREHDRFPEPIITPTTKAKVGHDEDISRENIISEGIVTETDYLKLEDYTLKLFNRGTKYAKSKNLILVDTKYEFGKNDDKIFLVDEIHTPDSSRYFYEDTYQDLQNQNQNQRQLSKEFVREWLIDNGFQGKEGQVMPEMNDERVNLISERYIELYENITGEKFIKRNTENMLNDIESNINIAL